MIQENYVSFETAKLLKDNGFDARCPMIYTADSELLYADVKHHNMYAVTNKQLEYYTDIIAPSQSMAMKWLREVHKLHIGIARGPKGYHITIETIPLGVVKYITKEIVETTYVDSYEEGCEAAIKFCLENLI